MTRSTAAMEARKIYVRDVTNSWYLGELPGLENGLFSLAELIQEERERYQIRETICLGCSMGGFGAILVGLLTGADRIVAFSPQSFVDRTHRILYADRRSWDLKERLHRMHDAEFRRQFFDLKPIVEERAAESTEIAIHVPRENRLDRIHARRLQRAPIVRIHEYPFSDHTFVRRLSREGKLLDLITDSADAEP
ncbi:MAG TPA: hypothetical protein VF190_05110 [Rhodothermales bacterium]